MPTALSEEDALRYRRQIIMPEIGEAGQQRIKKATVMIAGVGGLGGLSACYMAAAGVGGLKLVDNDRVAVHNLNRQILYTTADIGKWKTDCAFGRLKALNPSCCIDVVKDAIGPDTTTDIADRCDLIIDGTDSIETRMVLNRIAVALKIPFIFGGVSGFDGMLAAFSPGRGACLACMFPDPQTKAAGDIGIIGPTAGVIASLQSMEAVKRLIGKESSMPGALIHFHGLGPRLKKTVVSRNPECPVCA
ncbi:MAG: HesA/MoeB/ThiF family protein [Desulfosarcinaceae bacterium]